MNLLKSRSQPFIGRQKAYRFYRTERNKSDFNIPRNECADPARVNPLASR